MWPCGNERAGEERERQASRIGAGEIQAEYVCGVRAKIN